MATSVAARFARAFAPPRYLAPAVAGFDVSVSGVKAVRLGTRKYGVVVERAIYLPFPENAYANNEAADRAAVVKTLREAASTLGTRTVQLSLPESKSYGFETTAQGATKDVWRIAVEQHLEELVPLPPAMTMFDVLEVGRTATGEAQLVGVGLARRVVDQALALADEAGLTVYGLEAEQYPATRALVPATDTSTILIVDIGKTTTKLIIAAQGVPRFTTTVGIGGHTLTLAIMKHFGVEEEEAEKIKLEKGITEAVGHDELQEALLSTVAAIRDEILTRLQYWQTTVAAGHVHAPVSHVILTGWNATIRGVAEYFESTLKVPVTPGNPFTNLASTSVWTPPLEYQDALSYATAVGLALPYYRSL